MTKNLTYKNITIVETRGILQINLMKRYEWSTYAFLLFTFGFIFVMLYLLGIAEEQKEGDPGYFFIIMKLIFYGVGSILFFATIYETLKRESIEIDDRKLMLINKVYNFTVTSKKYDLKEINNIQPAPPPTRGWQLVDNYDGSMNKWRVYSNDFRKVYPTIIFDYENELVAFANGLLPEESLRVIELIKTKKNDN
jgi:hypothetical protein